MKRLLSSVVFLIVALLAPAPSEAAAVEGAFWGTSIPDSQVLAVAPVDKEALGSACKNFEWQVRNLGARPRKWAVEEARSVSLNPNDALPPYVNTRFQVQAGPSRVLVARGIEEANRRPSLKSALPGYSAPLGGLRINDVGNNPGMSVLNVPDSLTAISVRAGLPPKKIKVASGVLWDARDPDGLATVVFEGLDSACDLLAGRAVLELSARADAHVTEEHAKRLESVYAQVTDAANDALAVKKGAAGRAALLGYKLAGMLDREALGDQANAELYLGNIVERFFDASMNPNGRWYQAGSGRNPTLLVPLWEKASITVVLKKQ